MLFVRLVIMDVLAELVKKTGASWHGFGEAETSSSTIPSGREGERGEPDR